MIDLDILVGSGGVISHAPDRRQAAAMLIDAFQPEGVTRLAVDSIFMMPHLGVLSAVDEAAATEVFEHDCLIYLGTCVAPVGQGKPGTVCLDYDLALPGGTESGQLLCGGLHALPLAGDAEADLVLRPTKQWDAGAGSGREVTVRIAGGIAGVVLDGRGRPILFTEKEQDRVAQVLAWNDSLELYAT